MLATALLALSLAAPSLPTAAPATTPFSMHPTGRVGTRGGPEFLDRVRSSPAIARVVLKPAPGIADKATVLPVHVDAWLKGGGPTEVKVDFGGVRAMTSDAHAEILFLGPPMTDAGADYQSLQDRNERWEVADAATGKVDQAVKELVAGGKEAPALAALLSSSPGLAEQASNRLALLSATNPAALALADAAVRDPGNLAVARTHLLSLLPTRLPMATVVAAAGDTEVPLVRQAAVEGVGRAAAFDASKKDAALPVLVAAGAVADPTLQLAAAKGLARLRRAEGLLPIEGVLKAGTPDQRKEVLMPLGELALNGNADALARLHSLEEDGDIAVARGAHLQYLRSKPRPPPPGSGLHVVWVTLVVLALGGVGLGAWLKLRPRPS